LNYDKGNKLGYFYITCHIHKIEIEVSYQSITCLRWLGAGRCKKQNHTARFSLRETTSNCQWCL